MSTHELAGARGCRGRGDPHAMQFEQTIASSCAHCLLLRLMTAGQPSRLSEIQLQRQLQRPRCVELAPRSGQYAEGSALQLCVTGAKPYAVENVERLGAEFHGS